MQRFTLTEITDNGYTVLFGQVYDLKRFTEHPGKVSVLAPTFGGDGADVFLAQHGKDLEYSRKLQLLSKYRVGLVAPETRNPPSSDQNESHLSVYHEYDIHEVGGFAHPRDSPACASPFVDIFEVYEGLANFPLESGTAAFRNEAVRVAAERGSSLTEEALVRAVGRLPMALVGHLLSEFTYLCTRWLTGNIPPEDGVEVLQYLPLILGVPYVELANRRGVKPVVTHDAVNLNNWRRKDPSKPPTFSNIDIIRTLTLPLPQEPKTPERNWYAVHVAVEAALGPVIGDMFSWATKVVRNDCGSLSGQCAEEMMKLNVFLVEVAQCLDAAVSALANMNEENVPPVWFFDDFRKNLAGSNNETLFPSGVAIKGTAREPLRLQGGSGAQSPALQALDIFLGVKHRRSASKFLEFNFDYMSGPHRRFLRSLSDGVDVVDWVHWAEDLLAAPATPLVAASTSTRRQALPPLEIIVAHTRELIANCVNALQRFREDHLRIVNTYVMAQIARHEAIEAEGAATVPQNVFGKSGTGGSNPVVLLRSLRDSTVDHLRSVCPHFKASPAAHADAPLERAASTVDLGTPVAPFPSAFIAEVPLPVRVSRHRPNLPGDPTCAAVAVDDLTQTVTPWEASSQGGFDYMKLIRKFGSQPITGDVIKRVERLTNMRAHRFLRRGLFFSQRDLELCLDAYEQGREIYLYTGRGPSSEAMHLGHLVPFDFTKYLQEAFGAILVVQMSDDEKYYFKDDPGKSLEYYQRLGRENAKDIIARGFDVKRTYIFSNTDEVHGELQKNVVRMMKATTGSQIKGIFGLSTEAGHNVGQIAWPVYQSVPAYSTSFPSIFPPAVYRRPVPCLVPMAIDQDPYFRLARDFTQTGPGKQAKALKPSAIHSEFLVGLGGINDKMSSSTAQDKTIFLTDKPGDIERKVRKFAFTGGGATLEDHKRHGAALDVDVPYQYLLYFLEDDAELERIATAYGRGEMSTREIKEIMIQTVTAFVLEHQRQRERVTDDVMGAFFSADPSRVFDHSRPDRPALELLSDEEYSRMGCGFDRYFGQGRRQQRAAQSAE